MVLKMVPEGADNSEQSESYNKSGHFRSYQNRDRHTHNNHTAKQDGYKNDRDTRYRKDYGQSYSDHEEKNNRDVNGFYKENNQDEANGHYEETNTNSVNSYYKETNRNHVNGYHQGGQHRNDYGKSTHTARNDRSGMDSNKDQKTHSPTAYKNHAGHDYNIRNCNNKSTTPKLSESAYEKTNADDEYHLPLDDIPSNDWIFNQEHIRDMTPSRISPNKYVDYEQEITVRTKCVQRIVEIALTLNLNKQAVIFGGTYIHRYFMFNHIQDYDYKLVAGAAICIAVKAAENLKKLETIVRLIARMINPEIEGNEESLREVRDSIILLENKLLIDLKFDTDMELPFTHFDQWELSELFGADYKRKLSWFPKITMYTPAVILYSSKEIAAASFFLTCLHEQKKFPGSLIEKFDVDMERIGHLATYVHQVFSVVISKSIIPPKTEISEGKSTPILSLVDQNFASIDSLIEF
ncbi:hypothetical protein DASC09_041250 [Saccharomycopsis crataegensis]|uniref:Cyclin N-terminal domain-containing protein n=1 Tax=Saccharomycopsis crataegensis TaxID=43959 RepID=A0AAV5QR92_9ASCO|nr:hypothetical protein DASC09_041250 [Saccharomycopsis crataegensis]